jgi:mRNA-degrading endonuclease toxin of MazEF toxin-antitoxin module
VRPALVVQSDALNHRIDDTVLAAISRSTHRASPTQLLIDLSTPDGAASGLRQNSMVQCENLLTYDQRLIIAMIGRLSPVLMQQINACLRQALDL